MLFRNGNTILLQGCNVPFDCSARGPGRSLRETTQGQPPPTRVRAGSPKRAGYW
ncbi:MAG TPA: hypothetical protein VLB04_08940 [Methanotrichaceae archaeon]|nr:hypothetical protein [Methanotrichaceae archaeon]